jgi:outer membrane protein OmpA-like peptidoglycan-associated protein
MKSSILKNFSYTFKTVFVLGFVFASTQTQAFNYQQYSRSFSLVFDKIEDVRLDESYVNSNYDFLYSIGASYVDEPLVVGNSGKALLENMTSINLGMASYVSPWFMIGANTSYSYVRDNNGNIPSGFNDVQLLAKIRILNERRWAMGIMPYVTIPTAGAVLNVENSGYLELEGQKINVLSDEDFGYGVKLATEFLTRYVQFAINAGYKYNKKALVSYTTGAKGSDMTQQLQTGFGAYVPLHRSFGLSAEWMRLWSNPLLNAKVNPNEFMFAASAGLSESLNGFLGFSVGSLINQNEGNNYRITAGLKVAPCTWGVVCKKEKVSSVSNVEKELVESSQNELREEEIVPSVYESNLEQSVSDMSSEVTYVVRYPQNIAFISMKDRARLKKVLASVKNDLDNIKAIKIVGHASAEGDSSLNKKISYIRAIMMKDELLKEGIPANKIQMGYFGSDQPSEADLPANRRVELQIVR